MGYFLVLFFLIFSGYSCSRKDILLKNHELIGTSVTVPEYTLVLSDFSQSQYISSSKVFEINADLMTLDMRLSASAQTMEAMEVAFKGIRVTDILLPQTKLKVKQVYRQESLSGSSHFVVATDNKGKQYTVLAHPNEVIFSINDCKTTICRNWEGPLTTIMKSKTAKHKIILEYDLKDTKGNWIYFSVKEIKGKRVYGKHQLRPPYPKGMLKRSRDKLVDFLVQRKVAIIDENKHHPYITVQVGYLEYGDLLLNHEELGISSVSTVE